MENKQSDDQKTGVKNLIEGKVLKGRAKAELLFKLCKYAKFINPELAKEYFVLLKKTSSTLSLESQGEFNQLKGYFILQGKEPKGKYATNFISRLEHIELSEQNLPVLAEFETELKKRWWPLGKDDLRYRLMKKVMKIDRAEALKYLKYFSNEIRAEIVKCADYETPLTGNDWQYLIDLDFKLSSIIFEKLDKDNAGMILTETVLERLGETLLNGLFSPDKDDNELKYSEKTINRYMRLARMANGINQSLTRKILEQIYENIIKNSSFDDKWPQKFSLVRRVMNEAVAYDTVKHDFYKTAIEITPSHIKPFAASQWAALNVSTLEDASSFLKDGLKKLTGYKNEAEAWFLITLVRCNKPEMALTLAKESANRTKMLSRVRRAIVQTCPNEKAMELLNETELKDDVITNVFIKPLSERVEYLRRITDNGKKAFPKGLWQKPDFIFNEDGKSDDESEPGLLSTYSKFEEEENMFREYARINGFGQYSYDEIDPLLLNALVEWDRTYPDEVPTLINELWKEMEPDDLTLKTDLLRNTIFNRCRKIFSVRPELLDSILIQWIKSKLVDNHLFWSIGNTQYTLKFSNTLPVQYSLICAETWGKVSLKKCDELIIKAIEKYHTDDDWMRIAAGIYSTDKGLEAIDPPIQIKKQLIDSWQAGVIKYADNEIISFLLENKESGLSL